MISYKSDELRLEIGGDLEEVLNEFGDLFYGIAGYMYLALGDDEVMYSKDDKIKIMRDLFNELLELILTDDKYFNHIELEGMNDLPKYTS